MTNTFKPTIYIFHNDEKNTDKIKRMLGKDNIEVIKLTNHDSIKDDDAAMLADLIDKIGEYYEHLVIVNNYQEATLSALYILELNCRMIKVETAELLEELSNYHETYEIFSSWHGYAEDLIDAQEALLDQVKTIFPSEIYKQLKYANSIIANRMNDFENIFTDEILNHFEHKFSVIKP